MEASLEHKDVSARAGRACPARATLVSLARPASLAHRPREARHRRRARARSDGHAGNRCHYLAWVAHFAEDRRVVAIARESLAASEQVPNEYSRVQLAAWPLHALSERSLDRECLSVLPGVIDRARGLTNPVNRLDALEHLLHGVFPVEAARQLVLGELIAACRAASSWKAPRCLARTATLLGSAPDDLARVLAAQPEGPHRRQAERILAAGGAPPRRFFL